MFKQPEGFFWFTVVGELLDMWFSPSWTIDVLSSTTKTSFLCFKISRLNKVRKKGVNCNLMWTDKDLQALAVDKPLINRVRGNRGVPDNHLHEYDAVRGWCICVKTHKHCGATCPRQGPSPSLARCRPATNDGIKTCARLTVLPDSTLEWTDKLNISAYSLRT